jgi:Chitin binding Peritrophin-A domain.
MYYCNFSDIEYLKIQKGAPCNDGEFSGAQDCNKYLICMWGTYQEFSCASGLHWNRVIFYKLIFKIHYFAVK